MAESGDFWWYHKQKDVFGPCHMEETYCAPCAGSITQRCDGTGAAGEWRHDSRVTVHVCNNYLFYVHRRKQSQCHGRVQVHVVVQSNAIHQLHCVCNGERLVAKNLTVLCFTHVNLSARVDKQAGGSTASREVL